MICMIDEITFIIGFLPLASLKTHLKFSADCSSNPTHRFVTHELRMGRRQQRNREGKMT